MSFFPYRFSDEPSFIHPVDSAAFWRWPWLLWWNGGLGSVWLESPGNYPPDYHCSGSYRQIVTDRVPTVRLSVGKIAEHQIKTRGDALQNAYRDFLNRLIRQQKTIDKLKRDCGCK